MNAPERPANASVVAVIGAGYVGLTTAACFARLGHEVTCTDVDASRVARLRQGEIPIHEPGLSELVRDGLDSGRLSFAVGSRSAAANADFVYLCVPTPRGAHGGADLRFIEAATAEIAPHLRAGAVVVNKSTVPTGSASLVERILQRDDIGVASNPEFLREGTAVYDFLNPDRVVIGAEDRAVAARVARLYESVRAPVLITDPASAETLKYAANAFLATKLSFANAMAALCEAVGANVIDVLSGIGLDHRIGEHYLSPGPGWGGSCLPKDTSALIAVAEANGYDFALLRGVVAANEAQFKRIVDKVAQRVDLRGARVAVLGLAFKAGTDDIRESPALEIARRLAAAGSIVQAFDPAVPARTLASVPGIDVTTATEVSDKTGNHAANASDSSEENAEIVVCDDAYAACEGASAVVIATEWDEFRHLDWSKVARLMAQRHVIDARNLLDRAGLERRGFTYSGIGVC